MLAYQNSRFRCLFGCFCSLREEQQWVEQQQLVVAPCCCSSLVEVVGRMGVAPCPTSAPCEASLKEEGGQLQAAPRPSSTNSKRRRN